MRIVGEEPPDLKGQRHDPAAVRVGDVPDRVGERPAGLGLDDRGSDRLIERPAVRLVLRARGEGERQERDATGHGRFPSHVSGVRNVGLDGSASMITIVGDTSLSLTSPR